jgi:hypothetical protein
MGRQQVRRLICISSEGIEIPPGLPWPQPWITGVTLDIAGGKAGL